MRERIQIALAITGLRPCLIVAGWKTSLQSMVRGVCILGDGLGDSDMQILGWILIVLGAPFAVCNWYSPVSEAVSGKHSSMVPPLGGLLVGIGVYLLTGSVLWASLGLVSDLGLVVLVLASPWLMFEVYSHSRFALIGEFHAWRDGHRKILKLYKRSIATISYSDGSATYRFEGKWSPREGGYRLTGYLAGRECDLKSQGEDLHAAEQLSTDDSELHIVLNGLKFSPVRSSKGGLTQ